MTKFLFADFARVIGIITPSPIMAPFFRAILRAFSYLRFCFHLTTSPNIWYYGFVYFVYKPPFLLLESVCYFLYFFLFENLAIAYP